jgi:hypothetical protein
MVVMVEPEQLQLDSLQDRLAACAKLYLTSDIDSQRLAVATALLDVARYFEGQGFSPDYLLTVIRPAVALAERENNSIDPLFSQRPRNGRPKSGIRNHMRNAILAVLANHWLRIHRDEDRKQSVLLAEAARNMRGPWFNGVSAAALKTAREIISREAKDHPAVEFAERFSQFFESAVAIWGDRKAFSLMVRYINGHELSRTSGIFETPNVSQLDEG